MTMLDRVIEAFKQYDEMVEDLMENHNDCSKGLKLKELRKEVEYLIGYLKRYGCRRDEQYLKSGMTFYGHPKR